LSRGADFSRIAATIGHASSLGATTEIIATESPAAAEAGAPAARKLTDCHVHLVALPDAGNGCYISPKMLRSPLARFIAWQKKYDLSNAPQTNAKFVADLVEELGRSRHVGRAVLLAMDGVYDAQGKFDPQGTEFIISNRYLLEVTRAHPGVFWAGVSINPQRADALEEVDRCAEGGARLVKVLPNAQQFDPGDRRYIPFYRALERRRLPLLSHVGYEFSLIGKDQSAGDPAKLRVPLDEGVTVIAAHGCSNGLVFGEKFFPTMLELARSYRNFYSDISALTLPNRCGMLLRLRRCRELFPRLLFGTDYPLPVFSLAAWGRAGFGKLREIRRADNRFDRQYLICRQLGLGFRSVDEILPA